MSDCCIFYASTHNVVTCVNKCVISMSDCCMFYASTHNVVTFFFVQMSSSETESDSENDNESESELESYTLQILKEHVQF
jgi:hypothetical protein